MAMECLSCGVELPDYAHFCSRCGVPVTSPEAPAEAVTICGYCEAELPKGAQSCRECGEIAVAFSQEQAELQQLIKEAPIDEVVDFDDPAWKHIMKQRARRYVRSATRNASIEVWAPLLYQQDLLEAVVAWAWSIEATTLHTTNPQGHEALFRYAALLWLLYDVGPFGKGYIQEDWTLAPEVLAYLRKAGYALETDVSVPAPPLPQQPTEPKRERLSETKRSLAHLS
jgi:ribosomal protein L40E